MHTTIRAGDYVRVSKVPGPWEGSGESDADRESLVGHVGVVVEAGVDNDLVLVRFPYHGIIHPGWNGEIGQRNIELDCLVLVSRPSCKLTSHIFEN